MEKRDIIILAQLLTAMKDSVKELERAYSTNNAEKLAITKKEILNFQKEIDSHI